MKNSDTEIRKEGRNVGRRQLWAVPLLKFVLILGVVVIHCNISNFLPGGAETGGGETVNFIVSLMAVCVPSFFILSGFLFFRGVERFSLDTYKNKLKRRVKTLLIPYLFWNIACAVLFLVKAGMFHFPGLGLIDNGNINWLKFLEGFLFIEENHDFPFAFAFWFIRNLMVFAVLAPLVWLVARRWWSVALLFIIKCVFDINLFGAEWFVTGAALGLHRVSFEDKKVGVPAIITSGAVYLLLGLVRYYYETVPELNFVMFTLEIAAAFISIYYLSLRIISRHDGRKMKFLCGSTFFIYAFHQCFATVNAKLWIRVFGCGDVLTCLLAFMTSLISIVAVCIAVYTLLKKAMPRILGIITGGR